MIFKIMMLTWKTSNCSSLGWEGGLNLIQRIPRLTALGLSQAWGTWQYKL